MKKNLIIAIILFFVCDIGISQDISGVYNTDYRQLTLNQNGNKVTGTYESGNGKLQGTLSGNKFSGTWTNSASNKTGKFEFTFNSDFSAFTGKYGYDSSDPSKRWNGTKSSSPTTVTAETKASIANISGVYTTDFKQLTLNQNGNEVTGTYENGNGKLRGTLSGNKFSGTWTNSASNKTGKFEFIFNSDFSAFTGKYGYDSSDPSKRWNGTRIKSSSPTVVSPPAQKDLPINVIGHWTTRGLRTGRGGLVIWQEEDRFVVLISWIDEENNLWKSYKGEGHFEGREMNFKVFPSTINGPTVDQGYVYHYTISPDNEVITGYYTRHGERNTELNWYYKRVE